MVRGNLHRALLEDLLAAPGCDAGWAAFLLRTCDAVGGSTANFIAHDFSSGDTQIAITARTDPAAIAAYAAHWHRFDPWAASPLTPQSREGSVLHGEALIAPNALHRTAFFNDFGRLHGIVGLAGFIEVSPRSLSCLSIVAPATRSKFSRADATFLESLLPSVRRALELHRRLAGAELVTLHSAAVLDRLSHAVLFLSRSGAILSTNRVADEILRARDGLSAERGELRGATTEATSQLRLVLAAAVKRDPAKAGDAVTLSLPRPSQKRSLSVVVAPLPMHRRALVVDDARVVMFVADPDRTLAIDPDAVRCLLHLTPAEAHLTCCVTAGMSLDEAATHLGLQRETVRSRLKVIFQKTGTHRQADLVRLALIAAGQIGGK
jgi:DNA-binding CsgD family transcriptional regulator